MFRCHLSILPQSIRPQSFRGGRSFLAALTVVCCATLSVQAQSYNLFFRAPDFAASVGGTVTVAVGLENDPEAVTGFSFGLRYDPAVLSLAQVDLGSAVTAALAGAAQDERFLAVGEDASGGVSVALILSSATSEAGGVSIPPGSDNEVALITYNVLAEAEAQTAVTLVSDVGTPPVPTLMDLGGVAQVPTGGANQQGETTVSISSGPSPFLRGDVNQSGRLDLLDGIIILRFLFSAGEGIPAIAESTVMNCLVTFNVDASTRLDAADAEDERDIEVTDAVFALNALFGLGGPPAVPFPSCGQPTALVSERMTCQEYLCR